MLRTLSVGEWAMLCNLSVVASSVVYICGSGVGVVSYFVCGGNGSVVYIRSS